MPPVRQPYCRARWQPARPTRSARALYLGQTAHRIHGTNQPSTIGTFVSSRCIRLTNEDVIDLYHRIQVGMRARTRTCANCRITLYEVGSDFRWFIGKGRHDLVRETTEALPRAAAA